MRNVSYKSFRESKKYILGSAFLSPNRAVYEIMLRNAVEPDRPHVTVQFCAVNMQFACRIIKVKCADTHS